MTRVSGVFLAVFASLALFDLAARPVEAATTSIVRTSATTFKAEADVDPFSTVNAFVHFKDDGTTLTVTGHGYGFDPNLPFVSLIYADPSFTRGALACIPPVPNPFTPPQMFIAYWNPVSTGSTERTLFAQKTGVAYVPLTMIDTVSVRYDSSPSTGNPANSVQTPARYWLQSCGRVK